MTHQQPTWQTGRKTDSISTPTSLPDSEVPVKAVKLEKVTLSDMQNLKTFC